MNQTTTFGDRIREERARLRLNQTKFGELGGVTKKTQMLYESSERSPDATYLSAVATAGVDVPYILTGNRTPERQLERNAALRKLANESGDPALSAAFMETDKVLTGQHVKRSPRYEHLRDILDHCTDDTVELLIHAAQKMIGR